MAQYQWKAPDAGGFNIDNALGKKFGPKPPKAHKSPGGAAGAALNTATNLAQSTNQKHKPVQGGTAGNTGNAGSGWKKAKPPGAPATAGAGTPPSTPGSGQTGPFTMQDWYGGNPLITAQNLANQNLQTQLGQTRARYGGMGLGNSSREALSEGTALAQSATGLGDVLANRGLGAYESDANRALAANQQLMNAGTGVTAVGAQEQQIPGMQALMGLLSQLTGQNMGSQFLQTGNQGYWTGG